MISYYNKILNGIKYFLIFGGITVILSHFFGNDNDFYFLIQYVLYPFFIPPLLITENFVSYAYSYKGALVFMISALLIYGSIGFLFGFLSRKGVVKIPKFYIFFFFATLILWMPGVGGFLDRILITLIGWK